MNRRRKRKVVIDTNVISSGIGDFERPQLDAVVVADVSREHIYTKEVDDELSEVGRHKSNKRHNPFFVFNIRTYRVMKRICMVDNKIDHENESDNPAKKRDKKVLRAAIRANADTIVTMDKKFIRKADGFRNIRFLMPDEYLKQRRQKRAKDK